MSERYDRLPVWAKDRINILEMRLMEAKNQIDLLLSVEDDSGSDTFIQDYQSQDRNGKPIGKGPTIKFKGKDKFSSISVRLIRENGNLLIMADRSLVVKPRASNTVEIITSDSFD